MSLLIRVIAEAITQCDAVGGGLLEKKTHESKKIDELKNPLNNLNFVAQRLGFSFQLAPREIARWF